MRFALIVAASLVVIWLAFLGCLAIRRPDATRLKDAARLVPDTLRLIRRLATDRTIARRHRAPIWLLAGYLALPVDLVPDFLPVIGYADDVILIAVVLRHLVKKVGPTKLDEHWPGSAEGLATLRRVLHLAPEADGRP